MNLCINCPHLCGVAREDGDYGFCESDEKLNISSICIHHGEEPVISGTRGICNIFFSHCNLQCLYCQNYQISDNSIETQGMSIEEVVRRIGLILDQGVSSVGFVSPTHMTGQVLQIMEALRVKKLKPVYVWNSNGYDRLKTIQSLDGLIDVYLPDFKYSDARLAKEFSGIDDYPSVALKAIKEMVRQRGTSLVLNDEGTVESGVIIRHLVLPGHVQNSIDCLRMIAEEISPAVYISLMSQYHPTPRVRNHPALGRTITRKEYDQVQEEYERLGFFRGWTQELESESFYNPDFGNDRPFSGS